MKRIFCMSIAVLLFCFRFDVLAEEILKKLTAVRLQEDSMKIDGRLDESVWKTCESNSDFTQRTPNEGTPSTERTEMCILYSDDAIYIGIEATDQEPDKIISRLSRRDDLPESDLIKFCLDTYHDRQTAYCFGINVSGVQYDTYYFNDTNSDSTWDAVWEGRAEMIPTGWSAEFRIPFSVLRFPPHPDLVFGFNLIRHISRKQEDVFWVLVPRELPVFVSRFGEIRGISHIKTPRRFEILPYVRIGEALSSGEAQAFLSGDSSTIWGVGGDLKYGISSNMTLDATVFPDFGQIEADPSVLNLSVFETFFEERRPFFIEGAKLFQTPYTLYYSRRIGRTPGLLPLELSDNETFLDSPSETTIYSAAKVTGKFPHGFAFGVLEAITAPEYATVKNAQNETEQRKIEPLTSFFATRMRQDIGKNSGAGLIVTSVNREESPDAVTGGLDWDLNLLDNRFNTNGQVALSYAIPKNADEPEQQTGYAVSTTAKKKGGNLGGGLFFNARSPEFEINDFGFLGRNNEISPGGFVWFNSYKKHGIFRQTFLNLDFWTDWNYDGLRLSQGSSCNAEFELTNFWWTGGGLVVKRSGFDDLDTRGGPPIATPEHVGGWLWLNTDERGKVSFNMNTDGGWDPDGTYNYTVNPGIRLRPMSWLNAQFSTRYTIIYDFSQFVTNLDQNADGQITAEEDDIVYGELETQIFNFTSRLDMLFTRDISLQLYLQPFAAYGDYNPILKRLVSAKSYDFEDLPTETIEAIGNPDFHFVALNSNLVLRWEYHPGSTIFLVWSQGRFDSRDTEHFSLPDDLGRSFIAPSEQQFLLKINYWQSF